VLSVARDDEAECHRGAVVRVEAPPFAPSALLLRVHENGVVDSQGFTRRSNWELHQFWHRGRQTLLDVIDLAPGGTECSVVDGSGDVAHAPQRILATALKQIAKTRRDEARRRERVRRPRGSPPAPPARLPPCQSARRNEAL
jgi:hypothetical protein